MKQQIDLQQGEWWLSLEDDLNQDPWFMASEDQSRDKGWPSGFMGGLVLLFVLLYSGVPIV